VALFLLFLLFLDREELENIFTSGSILWFWLWWEEMIEESVAHWLLRYNEGAIRKLLMCFTKSGRFSSVSRSCFICIGWSMAKDKFL
jgi:hypothetical protein